MMSRRCHQFPVYGAGLNGMKGRLMIFSESTSKGILTCHPCSSTKDLKVIRAAKSFHSTSTKSTKLSTLVLKGQVLEQPGFFLATVDNLPLVSRGDTSDEAESRLVDAVKRWVQTCEHQGNLESSFASAGYEDVNDKTEILLIFSDEDE